MPGTEKIFLTAEWRDLVMLNYEVEPRVLEKYVPAGTILDAFEGKTYVSLVGFQFCRTKLFGALPIPFHSDFDEVNLRFYVSRKEGSEVRRGVVFIAEIVPRWAVATTARVCYGENYVSLPMRHRVSRDTKGINAKYEWRIRKNWCSLAAEAAGEPRLPREGSLEQFITEHYWGYSSQQVGGALQYRVAHVPWRVWASTKAGFAGDASGVYGAELGGVLQRQPSSAFIAEGSAVAVLQGKLVEKIKEEHNQE